ncbi:hypothetical protein LCGC14_2663590, partial [marine sediment metagenome]
MPSIAIDTHSMTLRRPLSSYTGSSLIHRVAAQGLAAQPTSGIQSAATSEVIR